MVKLHGIVTPFLCYCLTGKVTSASPKTPEGIQACFHALQLAEKALGDPQPQTIQSVRRIANSLQHSPVTAQDQTLAEALKTLQDASDTDIHSHLRALLPRLSAFSTQLRTTPIHVLLVGGE